MREIKLVHGQDTHCMRAALRECTQMLAHVALEGQDADGSHILILIQCSPV